MLITIITITYQAEQFVERTLQSVLNQSCNDFEYVVIDGASTDGTLDLLDKYVPFFKERDIPFQWNSEPDKGIYDAMNKGLQKAQGTYIWFMNAGDIIASHQVVEKVKGSILSEARQPDFLYGETLIVDQAGNIMGERRLRAPKNLDWKKFKMGMLVCHQSMVVRKALAIPFNLDYKYSSDFDWSIRVLKSAVHIKNTHLILSHFMDGGVSKKKMQASLKERFQIMSVHYGAFGTAARHLWFVCRAAWFKLLHGWI